MNGPGDVGRAKGTTVDLRNFIIQLLSGMTTAGILFVVAAGLTLVFGAMRVINIAHGSFYMYAAFIVSAMVGAAASAVDFWIALLVAPVITAAMGAATEVLIMRRIYAKEHLTQLLATFALFLILADVALELWGGSFRSVRPPSMLAGQVEIAGRRFPEYNFFVMGVALAVGVGLWLLLQRTRLGWRIRAAVEDPETLATTGTNVRLLSTGVFTLGAFLAGIAGAVVAPMVTVTPGLDSSILVDAFIVTVIGGLGSVAGAAVGAVVIGVFQAFGIVVAPTWSSAFIYIAMILVLVVRPWGFFGAPER